MPRSQIVGVDGHGLRDALSQSEIPCKDAFWFPRHPRTVREVPPMQILIPSAEKIATLLKARGHTIAVAESSAGGLISAALLAVPGASAYFLGGAVVYTRQSRSALTGITDDDMRAKGVRSSSEPYAAMLAEAIRARHEATWGLAETGASGPTGNRYGDPAGHSCVGIAGPKAHTLTLRTGIADRSANMRSFGLNALEAFIEVLEKA
jgi:nicotinamide-nucleotide amidase